MNEHGLYGLRLLAIRAVASAEAWVAITARTPLDWALVAAAVDMREPYTSTMLSQPLTVFSTAVAVKIAQDFNPVLGKRA